MRTNIDWRPDRDPDIDGVAPAWKVAVPEDAETRPDWKASLEHYLIFSPASHPLWAWHVISLVHLRDIEGVPPAHLRFEEATHEVMCLALHPEVDPPSPDAWEGPVMLQPANWTVQFQVAHDESARRLMEGLMQAATSGRSIDSDFRRWWENSIEATAEHERDGKHAT